jgi:hypothetical protein
VHPLYNPLSRHKWDFSEFLPRHLWHPTREAKRVHHDEEFCVRIDAVSARAPEHVAAEAALLRDGLL